MEILESFALIGVITGLFVWYGIVIGRRENGRVVSSGDAGARAGPEWNARLRALRLLRRNSRSRRGTSLNQCGIPAGITTTSPFTSWRVSPPVIDLPRF